MIEAKAKSIIPKLSILLLCMVTFALGLGIGKTYPFPSKLQAEATPPHVHTWSQWGNHQWYSYGEYGYMFRSCGQCGEMEKKKY